MTGANAGSLSNITFSAVENLTGGTGNDTFKFSAGKSVTGRIDGGGGTDTLNYALYTTGVTVNLGVGTATGTGGVANIVNVTGSPANDTITGNSASNVLSGGGGSDVLNGGPGGNDTFILASTQGAATTVTGDGVGDTLTGANIANTWTLTGAGAGNVTGIAFTGINNLVGGTSTDAFAAPCRRERLRHDQRRHRVQCARLLRKRRRGDHGQPPDSCGPGDRRLLEYRRADRKQLRLGHPGGPTRSTPGPSPAATPAPSAPSASRPSRTSPAGRPTTRSSSAPVRASPAGSTAAAGPTH